MNDNNDLYFNDRRVSETLHIVMNQLQDAVRQISGALVLIDSLYIDAITYRGRMVLTEGKKEE